MTPETLRATFANAVDSAAQVRVRRPGALFQVTLPAYRDDGDGVELYVRPGAGDSLELTDLGTTRMRLGYGAKRAPDLDEKLGELAAEHGLALLRGELCVTVGPGELVAATLGLLQVEAQAERLHTPRRARSREAAGFRAEVRELLRGLFGDDVREGYFDETRDPEGLYTLDALVQTPRPLAIAMVPSDVEAERAIGTKLSLRPNLAANTRWIAIPRDLERLGSTSRRRLGREFVTAGVSFAEDRGIIEERLRDLAA